MASSTWKWRLTTNTKDIRWWFWAVTLAFIILALAGWDPGYYVVMALSGVHVLFFLAQEKSLAAYPTQIRLVYFAFTLFGFWPEVLKRMPWNRGREV